MGGGVAPAGAVEGAVGFADGFREGLRVGGRVGICRGGCDLVFVEGFAEVVFEVREVLPEEVTAIYHFAVTHVEEIDGEHLVFIVVAEDVCVFVVGGCHALLVMHLVDGDDLVAEAGGGLKLHVFCGGVHALGEELLKLCGAAFEEHLDVFDGEAVGLVGNEAVYARAEAALDVVLQAGARVVTV